MFVILWFLIRYFFVFTIDTMIDKNNGENKYSIL